MTTQNLSVLLTAILALVIGMSVILRNRRQPANAAFTVLCFNFAALYLCRFVANTSGLAPLRWVQLVLAILVPLSTDRFFQVFLTGESRPAAPPARWILVGTGLSLLLLLTCLIVPLHHHLWFRALLFVFVFSALSRSIYRIHQRQRAIGTRAEAIKLRYLFFGGVAAVLGSASDHVQTFGVPLPAVGNVIVVTYLYFISQALFQYRLLDLKEFLVKFGTLSALVLALSVIYGLLLAWVGRGEPGVFSANAVVASFVVLLLFDPVRSLVEERLGRWLFAERYKLTRRLRQLVRDVSHIIAVPPLVLHILGELDRSGRVTHASIYLTDPTIAGYRLAGHLGAAPPGILQTRSRALFLEKLRASSLLTIGELEHALSDARPGGSAEADATTQEALRCMQELHAAVSLPLIADDKLLGILNLADDRLREAYASAEIELFRRLATQTAITLRNSQLYEQMKARDRLAALGQMAAGLAHEIRNPLGAIKGAAQLLHSDAVEAHDTSPARREAETRGDLLEVIEQEVNRLDHVVSQFLGYARPDRGETETVNVNQLVHRTLQLLRSRGEEMTIVTDLSPDLPSVHADPDQLHQVFLNLALNAHQAMDESGRLEIRTSARKTNAAGVHSEYRGSADQTVEIVFEDNGRGIESDKLSDIFIPFFTTRQGGTGLGLPISQRIVQSYGGTIEVASVPGSGAAFTIALPAAAT